LTRASGLFCDMGTDLLQRAGFYPKPGGKDTPLARTVNQQSVPAPAISRLQAGRAPRRQRAAARSMNP
jgi:hypothetical protein